jgi:hypothetical protein
MFTFHWIRGHGDDRSRDTIENNRCHRLAESAAVKPVNLLYDEEYERLSGFNSFLQKRTRKVAPVGGPAVFHF